MSSGYIYVAHFPNQDQLVKIGMTMDPSKRSRSLNSTSLPTALIMAKTWPVANPKIVERACHNHGSLKPFRNPGKEWFNVPLQTAIAVCDQVCVGFSNSNFDVLYNDFKKLNVAEQKQFVVQFYRRWECAARLLTQFERDNPGFLDNNRSRLGTLAPAGVHPDAVKFWVEWHTLSEKVKQWQRPRKLDEYIDAETLEGVECSSPLPAWNSPDVLAEIGRLRKSFSEEFEQKYEPLCRALVERRCREMAIVEQMFVPRCSKCALYDLRMDPAVCVDDLLDQWSRAGGDRRAKTMMYEEQKRLYDQYHRQLDDTQSRFLRQQEKMEMEERQRLQKIRLEERRRAEIEKKEMEEVKRIQLEAEKQWRETAQYRWLIGPCDRAMRMLYAGLESCVGFVFYCVSVLNGILKPGKEVNIMGIIEMPRWAVAIVLFVFLEIVFAPKYVWGWGALLFMLVGIGAVGIVFHQFIVIPLINRIIKATEKDSKSIQANDKNKKI